MSKLKSVQSPVTEDCTPLWENLVEPMLNVYADKMRTFWDDGNSTDVCTHAWSATQLLEKEFTRMAIAADNWVQHCKSLKHG